MVSPQVLPGTIKITESKTENPNNAQTGSNCGAALAGATQYKETCPLAIWSFAVAISTPAFVYVVLGIASISGIIEFLALAIVPTVLALLFTIFALVRIRESRGVLRGQGFAIAAIGVLAFWLLLFIVSPRGKVPHPRRRQKTQFASIDVALELFNHEFDGYPPSDAVDTIGQPYCGAIKLCEAVMGQDLLGFHPDSVFGADGMDATGQKDLYPQTPDQNNLRARRGPFMPAGNARPFQLRHVYANFAPFDGDSWVLCDTYAEKRATGRETGMPILYYKANPANSAHDLNNPDNPQNIYNYGDNHALVGLGVPGRQSREHPLFRDPNVFYEMTRNYKIRIQSRPFRADSYILLSAGKDGLYGTEDDIGDFDMRWKPK